MDRRTHEPLSVAEAKERLRRAARSGGGRSATVGTGAWLLSLARQRPWLALGVAMGAGVVVGASKRARAQLPRILLQLLG
ncbi:MAG: hypothetical protein P8Y13_10430 [Deinococcales bacterium]|jgi:ElaB/YqjD/DUF883 family membrane-anchored ribosome-binding protein